MTALYTDDQALVRRLLAGDETAFEELMEQQAPRLYRFALARLRGDAEAAEEVTQETLLRAMPTLHTYRGEAALLSWLCTICFREIARRYRGRRDGPRAVELLEDVPQIRAALELSGRSEWTDPEREVLREEVSRLVQSTLDHLPARYGDALEWKYIDGLSVAQVASRLAITSIAAQSLLARARAAFREAFAGIEDLLDPAESGGVG